MEEAKAIAEQRPLRHPYKEMPLTGAHQSMLPTYRLSSSFGRIAVPDEFGNYQETATERLGAPGWLSCNEEFVVDDTGEVTNFRMPNGAIATDEQIQEDALAWATSFARDQRAGHVQNHDHDCTGTCVKYAKKKKDATELPQRSGAKVKGDAVPKCRFRFFRVLAFKVVDAVRYVMRRGKELVEKAFIATGNEENEFGKAVVPRGHPFRTLTQDVLQTTIRCNADYQYQKRAVPEAVATEHAATTSTEATATEQASTAPEEATFLPRLFYGCRMLTQRGKQVLTTLATAMRAANIADFYMTKYQSKAQEALGPTIQPLIAGMRRQEEAENAPEASDMSLLQRARQRIRRLIFCANRTHWLSACELCVFLKTGASCVKTKPVVKVFSGKGLCMMHECKRLLNKETASEGLLFAAQSSGRTDATPMQTFTVQHPIDAHETEDPETHDADDRDDESVAQEDAGEDSSGATEPADDDQSDATEHAETRHGEDADAVGDDEDHQDSCTAADDRCEDIATEHVEMAKQSRSTTGTCRNARTVTFSKTTTLRDDWLHRGPELQDMDSYHYARYIERAEMPRKGTAQGFHQKVGVFYLFDKHYPMSKNMCS